MLLLLQPHNGLAVTEMMFLLVIVSSRLDRYSLPSLLRILDTKGTKEKHMGTKDRERARLYWEFLSFLLSSCMRVKRPCLFRTLVLFSYYRRRGIEISAAYGIRKDQDHLDGHSWLIYDGAPFLENSNPNDCFTTLYTYPGETS